MVLSHDLGCQVVAEGVETPAAAAWLQAAGCGEAQGDLYARPLPAGDCEGWCAARRLDMSAA